MAESTWRYATAKLIAAMMADAGAEDADLLAVDYFLWDEILPLAEKPAPDDKPQAIPHFGKARKR